MHKPESDLENEPGKIFWYFKIQTDHQIPARRPDLLFRNKKKKIVFSWILPFLFTIQGKIKES